MRGLAFDRVKFNDGMNVTVRNGRTMAEVYRQGDTIAVLTYEGALIFNAVIEKIYVSNITDIPEEDINFAAEGGQRTHEGVLTNLRKHYRKKLNGRSKVTVIHFQADQRYNQKLSPL